MIGLLALGAFLLFGLLMAGAVLKLVFWLVFLPLRIAVKLIALPLVPIALACLAVWGLVKVLSRPAVVPR